MAFVTFGDSLTAGQTWAPIVAAGLGLTHENHAISSSQAADQAYLASVSVTPNGSNKYGVFLGTNDELQYGSDPTKRQAYLDYLRALIVYLSCGEKTTAEGMTKSGGWTNYSPQGGYFSSGVNATGTATINGDVAYVCFRNQNNPDTAGAVSQVQVGGAVKASRTGNGQVIGNTYLGQAYAPQVLRVIGLGAGPHSLDIVNAVGGKYTLLDYVTTPVQTYNPEIYVLNLPIVSPDLSWRADYNAGIAAIVNELKQDGRNVRLVDIRATIKPEHLTDGVHWNAAGHAAVAQAFLNPPEQPASTIMSYPYIHGGTVDLEVSGGVVQKVTMA